MDHKSLNYKKLLPGTGKNIKKGRDNTSKETMGQANYTQEILAIKD